MKSFTDLEQSKVLKDILPPESADMYYHNRIDIPDNFPLPIEWKHNNPLLSQEIPCWSLTALLNLFPDDYNIVFNRFFDENTKSTRWTCDVCNGISITFTFSWYDSNLSDISYDNPIDACVEMIEKLNKEGNLNFNKK